MAMMILPCFAGIIAVCGNEHKRPVREVISRLAKAAGGVLTEPY
jgi:hypothetical protein